MTRDRPEGAFSAKDRVPRTPGVRVGDGIVGYDVDTASRRTGVVVEVLDGWPPQYRIRNRDGKEWIVHWAGA